MTNVNSPRFWTKNAKTLDCLNLSFFIILIDHFYSRHSIQAKCWDVWESAKKNSNLFDHHLHEIFEPHSGTDYWTGPNFPNTSCACQTRMHSRLQHLYLHTPSSQGDALERLAWRNYQARYLEGHPIRIKPVVWQKLNMHSDIIHQVHLQWDCLHTRDCLAKCGCPQGNILSGNTTPPPTISRGLRATPYSTALLHTATQHSSLLHQEAPPVQSPRARWHPQHGPQMCFSGPCEGDTETRPLIYRDSLRQGEPNRCDTLTQW